MVILDITSVEDFKKGELRRLIIQKYNNSCILYKVKIEDFKYLWSFQHKRNSGIVDSTYPENLFKYLDSMIKKDSSLVPNEFLSDVKDSCFVIVEEKELIELLTQKDCYTIIKFSELTNKE